MKDYLSMLIPAALTLGFVRLCTAQIFWIWKLVINSLTGFLSLWLLNLVSGITGILYPINFLTALIAGVLGIPGLILLTLAQIIP